MPARRRAAVAALALALALPLTRRAAAHTMGTIFSSPVDSDSAAVFWNPAAMAGATSSRFDLVANLSIPQSTYQRRGIDDAQTGRPFPKVSLVSVRPEPLLGLIIDKLWHRRLRIGFDVLLPQAAGAAWPEYAADSNGARVLGPTRYHVTDAQVFTVFAQLGFSIVLHETFALGASVNVVLSRLSVNKHVDLANQPGVRDMLPCAQNPLGCENPALSTPLTLSGTGVSAGGSVGLFWQPIRRLRIGASYLSPAKVPVAVRLEVDSKQLSDFARQFLPGFGTIPINGSGQVTVTVPMRAHLAIAGDVHPRVELMALVRWINSSASEVVSGAITQKSSSLAPDALRIASVKNDEWMVTLRVLGRIRERWKLAASFEFVTSTVPEAFMTPSNLDFNSLTINLGANVRLTRTLALGASFSQSIVFARDVARSAFANDAPEPFNLPDPGGHYTANSEKLGVDLTALF